LIIFSIVCSFGLWIAINLNNQFQTVVGVQVKIEHLGEDQAIAVPLPSSVYVKIKGTGWQILSASLSPSLIFTIDFYDFHKRGMITTSKELKEHSNLPIGIEIIKAFPEKIELQLEEKISRSIPIRPILEINYREGFGMVGNFTVEPESVTLIGARSLVNTFKEWRTTPIRLTDVNTPVSITGGLTDSLHFEIERSTSSARIHFDVQPIAERTIRDIPVEIIQVPENKHVVLIPPKISIIIRSGVNNIAGLTEKDFHISVDYRSILLDTSGSVRPAVTGPVNVKIVQQDPESIQYVVRK
jgi:YbbR domain-containing protein